ncbi:hypothetical protein [Kitasatospora sp. NPDC058478]|uniref:hypothetical protein n=1 Tax=unclassified Kitasatospora TaxID=2633591 RepID=UPI00364EF7FB
MTSMPWSCGVVVGSASSSSMRRSLILFPGGLGQEELQPLYGRVLASGYRFGISPAGQCLVPVLWCQQSGQVLAEAAPLGG